MNVSLVVLTHQNLILATTRRGTLLWGLPGGKADEGEIEVETASRELREETGIYVDPKVLMPFHRSEWTENEVTYRVTTFTTNRPFDPTLSPKEDGILAKWVPWEQLVGSEASYPEYNLGVLNSHFAYLTYAR